MEKFILTILVVSNIGLGFEVAVDYEDAWSEYRGLTTTAELQPDLSDGDLVPDLETDCDHCCHSVAHFAGLIISNLAVPFLRASCPIPSSDAANYLANRSPPTPPPNA
jgi:hypothetical protein